MKWALRLFNKLNARRAWLAGSPFVTPKSRSGTSILNNFLLIVLNNTLITLNKLK